MIIALVIGYRRGWSEFVRKGLWIALLALPLLSRSPRRRWWLLAEALTFGWGMNEEVTVVSIRWILLPTGI